MNALSRIPGLLLALALFACAEPAPSEESPAYAVHYQARLLPKVASAEVTITISQSKDVLRSLDFNAPASRYAGFDGDGELVISDDRVLWTPPAGGGSLNYTVTVNQLRGGVFDARLTDSWGIFRLDNLFPPARARAQAGAAATATLSFAGPPGWRFETPYGPSSQAEHEVRVNRLFPRPVGWAIAGELGIRRDLIANRQIAVAAPVGEGFRRQDTLAFLRWTLPRLVALFPTFPERLLIVGSAQDMWRGGLSGPASLYLHPDRPLISGNATSTLLHELIHVAVGSTASNSEDWLVEGLAEYYSLEILRRSGGISQRRFDDTLDWLAGWVEREGGRLAEPSRGADTAYAVLTLHDLATRLQTEGTTLDALLGDLLAGGQITGQALQQLLTPLGMTAEPFDELPATAATEEQS